jgi:hypothetical protein
MSQRYLRRAEAARHLHERGLPCSEKTLAKYAVIGGGPIYSKFGRYPVYTAEDLDAWAQARIGQPVRSTSDYAASSPKEFSEQNERSVLTSVGTVTNSSDIGKVV